jgi:2-succinyl-5-enolpyruvyl-6-hydroxy-3-cyclohexene-1-carboxylate synthase
LFQFSVRAHQFIGFFLQGLFGIPCHRPATAAEFTAVYREACAGGAPAIIEVRSERAANLAAHRALGEAIVAAVESRQAGAA